MRAEGDWKQITAILPQEVGSELRKRLREEWDLVTPSLSRARGIDVISVLGSSRLSAQVEWDVLMVTVEAERADRVFNWVYTEGDVGRPSGGFVYMGPLAAHTHFELPEQVTPSPHAEGS